jgi:excisionase family DNA binding protein
MHPDTNGPLLLTAGEVADLLRSTRKSIYEQARKGRLPGATRIGRKLLFRRDRLLQFIRESCVPSVDEMEA